MTALQNTAELHRKQGRYAEAVTAFAAVLEIDDTFALAHWRSTRATPKRSITWQ